MKILQWFFLIYFATCCSNQRDIVNTKNKVDTIGITKNKIIAASQSEEKIGAEDRYGYSIQATSKPEGANIIENQRNNITVLFSISLKEQYSVSAVSAEQIKTKLIQKLAPFFNVKSESNTMVDLQLSETGDQFDGFSGLGKEVKSNYICNIKVTEQGESPLIIYLNIVDFRNLELFSFISNLPDFKRISDFEDIYSKERKKLLDKHLEYISTSLSFHLKENFECINIYQK